jgi:hypothetical protein
MDEATRNRMASQNRRFDRRPLIEIVVLNGLAYVILDGL